MKNMKYQFSLFIIITALLMNTTSCRKQNDWLDIKKSRSDVTPTNLKDIQALLDDDFSMNSVYPSFGLISSDNNYITDANYLRITKPERNAYVWKKNIFEGTSDGNWFYSYQMVRNANIALDAILKIHANASNQLALNNLKGAALFYRSFAYYNLSQLYCKPFDPNTSSNTPGIPLRSSSDINATSTRATVKEVYAQMVNDLNLAIDLLPESQVYKTRPTSIAAMALLAKIYLSMEDYINAGKFADLILNKSSTLLDFNDSSLPITTNIPFPNFYGTNPEIIFYATCAVYFSMNPKPTYLGYATDELYNSYQDNDLRKSIFYKINADQTIKFIGSYTGDYSNFGGLANNEIYLISSECLERNGNYSSGMDVLNILLKKRYKKDGSFVALTAASEDDALRIILRERRKELPYTGQLRWEDLRRLNKDSRFAITQTRIVNGITYTLAPNDNRYTYTIPDDELRIYNLEQNP